MKPKIYGILTVIVVLIISSYASSINADVVVGRTHQHIDSKIVLNDDEKENTRSSEAVKETTYSDDFQTHLPIVIIDTKGEEIPGNPIKQSENNIRKYTVTKDGSTMLDTSLSIIDNKDEYNHLSDKPKIEVNSKIRIRGNSSRHFPKKNYLLRFEEDNEYIYKKVMGMDAHYEWALHGPYLDKTLMRNYMWYNISGEIMEYAPNVRFCEVFINDEYKGLYLMTETVSKGEENSRINIKKTERNARQTGYILKLDRGSLDNRKNVKTLLNDLDENPQVLDIKFPRSSGITNDKKQFIKEDFSKFEKSLFSYDFDSPNHGYQNYIDVMNFVDYYIINEFSGNLDAGIYSTYIYKNINGKYKKVVWDFNNSCDNYIETTDSGDFLQPEKNVWDFMLFKDEHFTELVINRYKELRKTYLSEEYLLNYIDDVREYLGDAVDRNYEVWGSAYDDLLLKPEERNIHSYDESIDQLKEYIINRGRWMDNNIEILRQYSHNSRTKYFQD